LQEIIVKKTEKTILKREQPKTTQIVEVTQKRIRAYIGKLRDK
jgi:hypothetical protein